MSAKRILSLDIATVTGFALGPAGKIERSGSVRLKKPADETFVAWENIGMFLRDLFVISSDRPDIIVTEAALPPGAGLGGQAVVIAWGCLSVVHFVAKAYEIPVRYAHSTSVAKHYTGRGRWGDRDEKKRETVKRAQLLGHIPFDCKDNDRADACAIHDFASATWFGARPENLVMFGERPAA